MLAQAQLPGGLSFAQLLFALGIVLMVGAIARVKGSIREVSLDLSRTGDRAVGFLAGLALAAISWFALGVAPSPQATAPQNVPATTTSVQTPAPVTTLAAVALPTPTADPSASGRPSDCQPPRCTLITRYTAPGQVATADFDRTGRKLMVASKQDPIVWIWADIARSDVLGYTPVRAQNGGDITATVWDPIGGAWPCRLGTGWADGYITLWDDNTRQINWQSPTGQAGPVRSLAFDWRGAYLAAGSDDETVRIWAPPVEVPVVARLETGYGVPRVLGWRPSGTDEAAASSRLGPCDGRPDRPPAPLQVLASGTDGGVVLLWDPDQAWAVLPLRGHTGAVRSLAWSPDGRFIASGGDDQSVLLWDRQQGSTVPIQLLSNSSAAGVVHSIAWSRDGDLLASGSDDGIVRLWQRQPTGLLATYGELRQSSEVTALSWTWTTQNVLAIAVRDRTISLVGVTP